MATIRAHLVHQRGRLLKLVGKSGFRSNSEYLPPNLPKFLIKTPKVPANPLWSTFPVTRYWGHDRYARANGFSPPGIPEWLARFDWLVGWSHGWGTVEREPASIFSHPGILAELEIMLSKEFGEYYFGDASMLVIGGADQRLSAQDPNVIERLATRFGQVYYEAYDTHFDGVDVMPIGLQEFYLRGHEGDILRLSQRPPHERENNVLAAWGRFWPQLNERISDRFEAVKFVEASSLVDAQQLETVAYFEALSSHRFMLCPMGNGIQTPKMFEAWMMGCIPIATRNPAFERLHQRGFPIALVDKWEEVTQGRLDDWSGELATSAEAFRVSSVQIPGYWTESFGQRV
jgi:hypothetical protein